MPCLTDARCVVGRRRPDLRSPTRRGACGRVTTDGRASGWQHVSVFGRVGADTSSCMSFIAFVCTCVGCCARVLACVDVEPGAVMVPGSRGGSGAGTTNAANRDALGVATVRYHDVCVVCLVVNDILSARLGLSPVVAVLAPVRHMSSRVVTECCANRVRAHYTDASRTQRSAEGPVSNRHARQGRGGSEPPRDAIFREAWIMTHSRGFCDDVSDRDATAV